jgi:outer membrane protein assembly factor BamD (BamD/ComL family)
MNVKCLKIITVILMAFWFLVVSLDAAAQGSEKYVEDIYKEGKQAIYRKDWQKAAEQFRHIVDAFPGDGLAGESLYWLSYALEKSSESLESLDKILACQKEALAHLEKLLKHFPDSRWADDAELLRVEIAGNLVKKGFKEYKKYILNGASRDSNIDMKLVALDALMHMDREKAFPMLEKVIRGSNSTKLREKAIFVLSQIDDPRVAPLLLEVAQKDSEISVREKAIFWLGQLAGEADPDVMEVLLKIYKSLGTDRDGVKLKEKIVFSIAQMGERGVRQLIEIYEKEKELSIKKKILFWLGQSGGETALKFIEKILAE